MGASPGPNLLPQALLSQWAESHDFAVFIPLTLTRVGKNTSPLEFTIRMNNIFSAYTKITLDGIY